MYMYRVGHPLRPLYIKDSTPLLPRDVLPVLNFQKKFLGPVDPQVFIFCHQNKYSGCQKSYLRINGFSFVKDTVEPR